jgi:hypothetical protein
MLASIIATSMPEAHSEEKQEIGVRIKKPE